MTLGKLFVWDCNLSIRRLQNGTFREIQVNSIGQKDKDLHDRTPVVTIQAWNTKHMSKL